MQLQQLTALLLATDAHVKTASCLASLVGLKQLTLRTFNLPDESLLCLAALTGLSVLSIAAVDDVGGFHGLSKELLPLLPGPSPPPGAQRTRLQFQDGWHTAAVEGVQQLAGSLQQQLTQTQQVLAEVRTELAQTKAQLATVQQELMHTRQ